MSISVQQLVQTAFQNCSLIGDGESVDGTAYGTAKEGALGLVNNLLSELNAQGFIAGTTDSVDLTISNKVLFIVDANDPVDPVMFHRLTSGLPDVKAKVPERLDGVSRRIGDRWLPLHSCDPQQMATRNLMQLPTSWSYQPQAYADGNNAVHEGGLLSVDSRKPTQIRVFFKRPIQELTETDSVIHVSDLYFDLLLNGLCVKLCVKYKLMEYLDIFEPQFKQSKNLIKRSNSTQRMLQKGDLQGGYNDDYFNGLGGVGW